MAKKCEGCGKKQGDRFPVTVPGMGTKMYGRCCKNLMGSVSSAASNVPEHHQPRKCASCGSTIRGGVCPGRYC